MISGWISGFVVLIPAVALASGGENSDTTSDTTSASLKAWSLEELCDVRERADVIEEIERRDLFTSRELRGIRTGELQTGMSLDVLTCVEGSPSVIVDAVARTVYGPVAAYVYSSPGAAGSAYYVFEGESESLVVYILESEDPTAIIRDVNYKLLCEQTGLPRRCRLEDVSERFRPDRESGYQGSRCFERYCAALFPIPRELPVPKVEE